MARILILTDSPELHTELVSSLSGPDHEIFVVDEGRAVGRAVRELIPDLVILDSQVGSMGGVAVCIDLRLEADAGRSPATRILLLLDRRADVFTAKRSGADGFVIKPINALLLGRAVAELLDGNLFLDNSYRPIDSVELETTEG
ncbi:MAG: response regulator transcription factor [Ferrimicrobium sp.]